MKELDEQFWVFKNVDTGKIIDLSSDSRREKRFYRKSLWAAAALDTWKEKWNHSSGKRPNVKMVKVQLKELET